MSGWKDMAKRLRENQKNNQEDFAKQSSIAEKRIKFLKEIEDEKAKVLSNTRRKRNNEISRNQRGFNR